MAALAGVRTGTVAAGVIGILLAATLLLTACETTPPGPDPTQVKLDDLETRLTRVERVISNQSLLELSSRIETLDTQLRQLRGEVEELQNSQSQLLKQQRDLYSDLDHRIAALESAAKSAGQAANAGGGGGSSAVGAAEGDAGTAGAPVGDQDAYTKAFDALKGGAYDSAIMQFRDFLRLHPQSPLADNAQYWLGEAYYVTRDFDDAVVAFRTVGERYPQSRKVPDALVKLGFSQYEQKHMVDARATLTLVVERYPGTDAAKLAADRIARMPSSAGP